MGVQGCDASVLISGPGDEHSAGADTTLSPDALDLITRAKAAVDAVAGCSNKVSCADILALATRDVVQQAGGPFYPVELGRLDGKVGTRAVVKHSLPGAGFSLDQLNKLFAANGLTQTDMIALSGGHTIGVTHCDKFVRRLYTGYYQTLQQQKGLLSSDQVLFADRRSRATVNHFAANQTAFFDAFVAAMAKLGRIGVKTAGSDAEIRRVCTKLHVNTVDVLCEVECSVHCTVWHGGPSQPVTEDATCISMDGRGCTRQRRQKTLGQKNTTDMPDPHLCVDLRIEGGRWEEAWGFGSTRRGGR
uniref:Peroxidase n=1 Tax=Aegilops tauschii TaxID=37682 RepID=M8B9G8_AEGTA